MNVTRTQWYPANIKPKHIGVYEKKLSEGIGLTAYQYWNGEFWCGIQKTIELAADKSNESYFQYHMWRGLANKP